MLLLAERFCGQEFGQGAGGMGLSLLHNVWGLRLEDLNVQG